MAETTLDLRGLPRAEGYAQLEKQARSVLEGVREEVAAMATWSCLLHHAFGHLWTGFYRVVEPGKRLRVGPQARRCSLRKCPDSRGGPQATARASRP